MTHQHATCPEITAQFGVQELKQQTEARIGRQLCREQFWRWRNCFKRNGLTRPPYDNGDVEVLVKFAEYVGYGCKLKDAYNMTVKYFSEVTTDV